MRPAKWLNLALLSAVVLVASAMPASAANRLYDKSRQAMVSFSNAGLSAPIDLATDTIKVALVTASYTPNTATHQFLSDLGATTLGTAQTLTFSSATAGVYKAGSTTTWTSVPAGTATYLVGFKDTGTSTTSPLIFLIDTATGIPVTSTGSSFNITVTWDPTNGIFKP